MRFRSPAGALGAALSSRATASGSEASLPCLARNGPEKRARRRSRPLLRHRRRLSITPQEDLQAWRTLGRRCRESSPPPSSAQRARLRCACRFRARSRDGRYSRRNCSGQQDRGSPLHRRCRRQSVPGTCQKARTSVPTPRFRLSRFVRAIAGSRSRPHRWCSPRTCGFSKRVCASVFLFAMADPIGNQMRGGRGWPSAAALARGLRSEAGDRHRGRSRVLVARALEVEQRRRAVAFATCMPAPRGRPRAAAPAAAALALELGEHAGEERRGGSRTAAARRWRRRRGRRSRRGRIRSGGRRWR